MECPLPGGGLCESKRWLPPVDAVGQHGNRTAGESSVILATDQMGALFDFFMAQVASADLDRDRRVVSYQQIDSFNRVQFAYPMDHATRLVKGVYATYDEFRENAPSILNYTIDTDPLGKPQLNIPGENGKMMFNHTAWGYCDGNQVYVMMDADLFSVFAVGHQFYVLGAREYSHKYTPSGAGRIGSPIEFTLGPIVTAAAFPAPQETLPPPPPTSSGF